jgi:CDP-L-myo-inositol myo-inositolphosphotransferase
MIGLCAGIGAAGFTYKGVLIGAILFELASIIDGCDGEVAKLTFRTSKFGQYIDSISDNLSLSAFITGMMIHEYRVTKSYHAFIWGGMLLIGAGLILVIMADYLKKKTNSASFVTYDKEFLQKLDRGNTPRFILWLIKYLKIFFKKDFFSTMFLVTAIFGILHWWFYIIAVGVWGGVAVLLYLRARNY